MSAHSSSSPSLDEFAARGLTEVEYDAPPAEGALADEDRESRVTGRALYQGKKRVRFRLARATNPAALDHFRRNHQLIDLLVGQRPNAAQTTASQSENTSRAAPTNLGSLSSGYPLLSPPMPVNGQVGPPPAPVQSSPWMPYVDRITAIWEDEIGGWTLMPADEQTISLETYWRTLLHQQPLAVADGSHQQNENQTRTTMSAYGRAVELLIQTAEIIQSLNECRIALAVVRSDFFQVNLRPARPQSAPQVELFRVATCVQLPGFAWGNPASAAQAFGPNPDGVTGSPPRSIRATANGILAGREADGDARGLYEDRLLSKHLAFLAPETISSRKVSSVGDVFSFGRLAYELLVGRTAQGDGASAADLAEQVHRHLTVDLPSPLSVLSSTASSSTTGSSTSLAPLPPKALSDIVIKCLSRDLDVRYSSMRSLLFDLRRFRDICRAEGDLSRFLVGHVDSLSRFSLPGSLISRVAEVDLLDKAFAAVVGRPEICTNTGPSGVTGRGGKPVRLVNVWGLSGSGKSKLVEVWADGLGSKADSQSARPLIGSAKLDQHLRKPLSGFVQLIQSLLDRVFSDPNEDSDAWRTKILKVLSAQGSVFLTIISPEWKAVLMPEADASEPAGPMPSTDWELFLPGFRVWSKQLLQIFATPERPLVLLLDDIQWLGAEELKLWQDILASPLNPFENVLLISLFRVEEDVPPPSSALVSKSGQTVKIDKFRERSVLDFLRSCFHWPADDGAASNLASFLWTETQGSPFYLRSLVTTMVRERVISFSFESLRWSIDFPKLRLHASEGVDAYLGRTLSAFPQELQQILRMLACLPSTGFPISGLSELVGFSTRQTETLLRPALLTGAISFPGEGTVRFSHDRNQAAAYRLVPTPLRGSTHKTIARYLQRAEHIEEHLFDAVDNELLALDCGVETEGRDELVTLILLAAQRAAHSASYTQARLYLEAVERTVDFSAQQTWDRLRPSCFFFFELLAEVSAVLRTSEAAISRIRSVKTFARTKLEELTLRTLVIRLLIASQDYDAAAQGAVEAFRAAGYDPMKPSAELLARVPKSADDVHRIGAMVDNPADESHLQPVVDDELIQAMLVLIGYVGPSMYISSSPARRTPFFNTAIALAVTSRSTVLADPTAYVFAVHAIAVVSDMSLRKACVNLSGSLLRPGSFFESQTLVVNMLQRHGWAGLEDLNPVPSFDKAMSVMNLDMATYVTSLDFHARLFSRRPLSSSFSIIEYFYSAASEAIPVESRVLVDIPLQAGEQLGAPETSSNEPWKLDGAFIRARDWQVAKKYPVHALSWRMNTLRLAFLFGAPVSVLTDLYGKTLPHRHSAPGLIIELEAFFFLAIYGLLYGDDATQDQVAVDIAEIARHQTDDYRARLKVLAIAKAIRSATLATGSAWAEMVPEAESQIKELLADGFNLLAGLASSLVANFLATKADFLAAGYVTTAYRAYISCEAAAVARTLRKKWPVVFAPVVTGPSPVLPSHVLTITPNSEPGLSSDHQQSDVSLRSDTIETADHTSTGSTTSSNHETQPTSDLTFMRSSLILAEEKDPDVLVVTLIRILCQFVRADYGAIALLDPSTGSLRLRGAGAYSRLSSYDLDFSHPDAAVVSPTSLLDHVNKTKKAITSVDQLQQLKRDSFYGDRLPRSILAIPLQQRGRDVGVVLLSSKTVVTHPSALVHAIEVVSCLATFAVIAHELAQSTANLERTVSERTAKLQDAVAAKSQFLSFMSHELRTPLFAVLGLAAVLEDSPGLDSVQREHLATIRTSGEDLQTLISNVLDYSRLESGSLQASQLESIPFSVRNVVEQTLDSVSTAAQRKGVELVIATAVSTVPSTQLVGDPFRVKQILLNLLSNSVKFTSHGSVEVSWEVKDEDPAHSLVSIHVKDTGVGIPPQKISRLFKSFSQIDSSITRSYGGSGLGLAISQQLAELMGGRCTATSMGVGSGSTFTFSFVASHTPRTVVPFPSSNKPRTAFLLAPDSVARTVLCKNLVAFGFSVVNTALDFASATAKDSRDSLGSTAYEIVIVDVELIEKPEVKQLKKMQPAAKNIFLARSIDLSTTIERLEIAHTDIVQCSPTKTSALFAAVAVHQEGAPKARSKTSAIDKDLARRHPLKILLVDDNAVNLSVGTRVLERFGYTGIVTAADGQLALQACERERFSLVLMDLAMPVMDGYESNKRIAVSPLAGKPIVVALSANTDDRTRRLVDSTGFFFYLTKPMVISVLAKVLADVHRTLQDRGESNFLPSLPSPAETPPSHPSVELPPPTSEPEREANGATR